MSEIQKNGNVTDTEAEEPPQPVFHLVPRSRTVPSMTDEEILWFRTMRKEFEKIKSQCPLAQRAIDSGT
jgi:hypothetical protein